MTPRVAIIADDLTGALDTSTPFLRHGLTVAVAVTLEGVAEALGAGRDVVAVNTASRDLRESEAAAEVAEAARALMAAGRPQIVFKKIDSRLKGNIGLETAALAECFGCKLAVVAPAVPDQDRFTQDGAVTGRGIDAPLAIARSFDTASLNTDIRDATGDGDLDAIIREYDGRWDRTLAVGARGLGGALARAIGRPAEGSRFCSIAPASTLAAFGSTDPITLGQIEALRGWIDIAEAPGGNLAQPPALLPALVHVTGARTDGAEAVAARLTEGVADCIAALHPKALIMGGGDTTLAVLRRLGARVVYPVGEAAPGLPAFDITLADGSPLRCVAKSGGFGGRDVLADLFGTRVHEPASLHERTA